MQTGPGSIRFTEDSARALTAAADLAPELPQSVADPELERLQARLSPWAASR